MTLQEFCDKNDIHILRSEIGYKVRVTQNIDRDIRWQLFHLDDYFVGASVSGPFYVMVKKKDMKSE